MTLTREEVESLSRDDLKYYAKGIMDKNYGIYSNNVPKKHLKYYCIGLSDTKEKEQYNQTLAATDNEVYCRITSAWKESIEKKIKLYDESRQEEKMIDLYKSYSNYLRSGNYSDEYTYDVELTEEGWELFDEIRHYLPSYILLMQLIRDKDNND